MTAEATAMSTGLGPDELEDLTESVRRLVENRGFIGRVAVVGSHAYGTERAGSDVDLRGFYIPRTEESWRLRDKPREQFERKDPDIVVFEVEKFMRLAAGCNPNVLEVIWAPYVLTSAADWSIWDSRHAFLSRRASETYGGYALGQLQKARRGSGGSRGVKHFKREKFILHLFRLMETGIDLLRTGELTIRVADPERLWEQASWPLDRVEREFDRLDAELGFALADSDLPEQPDWDRLNDVLSDIRRFHLVT